MIVWFHVEQKCRSSDYGVLFQITVFRYGCSVEAFRFAMGVNWVLFHKHMRLKRARVYWLNQSITLPFKIVFYLDLQYMRNCTCNKRHKLIRKTIYIVSSSRKVGSLSLFLFQKRYFSSIYHQLHLLGYFLYMRYAYTNSIPSSFKILL